MWAADFVFAIRFCTREEGDDHPISVKVRLALLVVRESSKLNCFAKPQILTSVHCPIVAQDVGSGWAGAAQKAEPQMKIHEYQAKAILARYGVTTPRGEVAFTKE